VRALKDPPVYRVRILHTEILETTRVRECLPAHAAAGSGQERDYGLGIVDGHRKRVAVLPTEILIVHGQRDGVDSVVMENLALTVVVRAVGFLKVQTDWTIQ
jgi:hypothetical protein